MAHQHDPHGHSVTPPGHGLPDHAEGHGEQAHDHDTTKYWMVFIALCVLTSMSFITMHFFHDTPSIGWTVMMAVSCAKALLVICFFMHLIWEASWKYVLTIPAAMMSLFLIFMLVPDIGCRTRYFDEGRWLFSADPRWASEHDRTPEHGVTPQQHDKGTPEPGIHPPKMQRGH
jgi:cytochrome c oxidase subunit IV